MESNRKLIIRKAGLEDIGVIRSIAEATFPATYRGIISESQIDYMMDWMYSLASLQRQFEEGHVYFIAFEDDKPVGYVSVQQEGEGLFHLHKIYVHPDCQGKGCGKLLFQRAVAHIKECCPGQCRMELNVNRDNKALGFYQSLGMKIVRQGDFDIGNGYYMNDYIMGLDI